MGLRCSLAPISLILPPGPIFLQAAVQVMLFLGSLLTRTVAVHGFQVFGLRAEGGRDRFEELGECVDARFAGGRRRTAHGGGTAGASARRAGSLSPMASLIWPIGRPRVSAATWVMMVRVPVPRSCVPISTSTEPSGLMVVRAVQAWPAPPQALTPMPSPRRDRAGLGAARLPELASIRTSRRPSEAGSDSVRRAGCSRRSYRRPPSGPCRFWRRSLRWRSR